MDDYISRREAIDAVNKNRDSLFHDSVHYEDVLYDISNLPSAQRWIPCSEELPPYGKHVLTWWKGVIAIDCRVPGYEEEWLLNVEAWMPLPEPYEVRDDINK